MKFVKTILDGLVVIEPKVFTDERGLFVKTFSEEVFLEAGLPIAIKESYYSISQKDVCRGMHFQSPPAAHAKLVYVTSGKITDIVLDIRLGSPMYGRHVALDIGATNKKVVYIPIGFAHGFVALEDDTCVIYAQSSVHAPQNDQGVHILSLGFNFGQLKPIISDRDNAFPAFQNFSSPFIFQSGGIAGAEK